MCHNGNAGTQVLPILEAIPASERKLRVVEAYLCCRLFRRKQLERRVQQAQFLQCNRFAG
jgi:hypothetical protein